MRNAGRLVPEWHSPRTHPPAAQPAGRVLPARVMARWLLLGVVIAAVFGLHVLTVDHGNHGDLPTAIAAGHPSAHVASTAEIAVMLMPSAAALDVDSPVLPVGDGDGWLVGCVLFLVVAGAGTLLLGLIRRRIGDPPAPETGAAATVPRCFPRVMAVPRLELSVIRI